MQLFASIAVGLLLIAGLGAWLVRKYSRKQKEDGANEVKREVLQTEVDRFRRNEGIDAAPLSPDGAVTVLRDIARRRVPKPPADPTGS